jgi:cytochrome c biogenesis DsbD-like protein
MATALAAQTSPTLTVEPPPPVKAHKASVAIVTVKASLPQGYHANSNTPTEPYLIPLKLTWTGGPLESEAVTYPKGEMEKYSFSDKPISVVSGEFSITTRFKVPADAPSGPAAQTGKLRYQACNDRSCFPPKTADVSVTVQVD